jgi:hypothetical protein
MITVEHDIETHEFDILDQAMSWINWDGVE